MGTTKCRLYEADSNSRSKAMASSFAAQLKQIAVTSTNELDLKAQKASHAESLIFEKSVAGSQDFETVYQVCLEGHQDLCLLDPRFRDFERNIFSPQSKSQDRTQMTAEENGALNTVLEIYLGLVGNKLLLRPAMKAVEWLVRRFKSVSFPSAVSLALYSPRSPEYTITIPRSSSSHFCHTTMRRYSEICSRYYRQSLHLSSGSLDPSLRPPPTRPDKPLRIAQQTWMDSSTY